MPNPVSWSYDHTRQALRLWRHVGQDDHPYNREAAIVGPTAELIVDAITEQRAAAEVWRGRAVLAEEHRCPAANGDVADLARRLRAMAIEVGGWTE